VPRAPIPLDAIRSNQVTRWKVWSDRIEPFYKLAVIISVLAVPIIVATMQNGTQTQSTNMQYVQMAVGVLREPATEKDDEGTRALRSWSVDLIQAFAPKDRKLPPEAVLALKQGKAKFGGYIELQKFSTLGSVGGWADGKLVCTPSKGGKWTKCVPEKGAPFWWFGPLMDGSPADKSDQSEAPKQPTN